MIFGDSGNDCATAECNLDENQTAVLPQRESEQRTKISCFPKRENAFHLNCATPPIPRTYAQNAYF